MTEDGADGWVLAEPDPPEGWVAGDPARPQAVPEGGKSQFDAPEMELISEQESPFDPPVMEAFFGSEKGPDEPSGWVQLSEDD